MPSTYDLALAAIDRTFLLLGLLVVLVMVPWLGTVIEEYFGIGDDDDPDGFA